MWTEIEGSMAIVVGCLPAMMPVFRRKGFGRKKPTFKPRENVNLVSFGSGGKNNIPHDISVNMKTSVTGTTLDNGNYTELIDHVGQENHARYYQRDGMWKGGFSHS